MAGQGMAGVTIATLNVITTAAYSDDNQGSAAFLFFLISLFVSLVSIITFFMLLKLPVVKYHTEKVKMAVRRASTIDASEGLSVNGKEGNCARGRPTGKIYPLAGDHFPTWRCFLLLGSVAGLF